VFERQEVAKGTEGEVFCAQRSASMGRGGGGSNEEIKELEFDEITILGRYKLFTKL
jgi:hypothetical protein